MNDDKECKTYDVMDYGNPLTILSSLTEKHNELKSEMDRIFEEINMITRAISYIRKNHFKECDTNE